MNTPVPHLLTRRLYLSILFFIVLTLLFSFGIATYFILDAMQLKLAAPILGLSFLLLMMFLKWVKRTIYFKFHNQAIIVKGIFNKTILTPLAKTDFEPILTFSKIMIVRIQFGLDGIQHSYFTFTSTDRFQKMKKRQAISRVL